MIGIGCSIGLPKPRGLHESIRRMFINNERGIWLDPSDISTVFQDSAGTTAAVVGQPVGLVLDKSKGLVLGPELVTNGTFDSVTGWVESGTTDWVIASGYASISNASALSELRYAPAGLVENSFYLVSFELKTAISGAGLTVQVGGPGGGTIVFSVGTTSGVKTVRLKAAGVATVDGVRFIAATGCSCQIDNVSAKLLPGYHATQSTSTARPILARHPIGGRRNLLTYTEDFSNAAWAISGANAAKTANYSTFSAGASANRLQITATGSDVRRASFATTVGAVTTVRARVKATGANCQFRFNLYDSSAGNRYSGDLTATSEEQVFTFSAPAMVGYNQYLMIAEPSVFAAVDILVSEVQVEYGSTPTAYQKVTSTYDVTEAGTANVYYLKFDGVDDFLVTPSIDFSGTDKMSVFAGVRKLSDAAVGILVELSASTVTANGSFNLSAPGDAGQPRYSTGLRGSVLGYGGIASFAAPITSVVTQQLNVGATGIDAEVVMRHNGIAGTLINKSAGDAGTGNFSNNPIYIGMRAGTSLPANMHLYSLIVRGALCDAAQLTSGDAYTNSKTRAY